MKGQSFQVMAEVQLNWGLRPGSGVTKKEYHVVVETRHGGKVPKETPSAIGDMVEAQVVNFHDALVLVLKAGAGGRKRIL